jgi:hypothetical protein
MQTTASKSQLVSDAIKGGMNHGNAEKENTQGNPEELQENR